MPKKTKRATGPKKTVDYLGAKTRHFIEKSKDRSKNLYKAANISFEEFRKVIASEGREILKGNIDVKQYGTRIKQLADGNRAGKAILRISQNKWFRKSMIGAGIGIGLLAVQKAIDRYNPQPVIPKNYERGYDVMNQTLTDFGSPVKLLKTASKIITPYFSSIRKGIVTTTSAISNQNFSLIMSKKAIGHTRY